MSIRRIAASVALLCIALAPTPTWAHGERSQEPFLRMRSIIYYDLNWSSDKVKVNDEMVLSGRFHVFDDWPIDVLGRPDTVYLNTGVPGPVFVRKSSTLNGVNMANSTALQIGGDYEFKMVLRARAPGSYHMHPLVNVYNAGPIVGPGKWITVEPGTEPFTNPAKTLMGQTLDLEHYGLANVVRWELAWVAMAVFWLIWWIRRPVFIPRYLMLQRGAEDELVTPLDRKVAVGIAVATITLVVVSNYWANKNYPTTIPLQSARIRVKPLPMPPHQVEVDMTKATYEVPGRTVYLDLKIANHADQPVRISEFTTANVRFLNAAVMEDDPTYPRDLVAPNGLVIDGDSPIAPGETRTVHLSATDPIWETERLALLIYDPDSRFGGMLMLKDSAGNRHLATIGGPILPTFHDKAL